MDIIKILSIAIVLTVVYMIFKQHKPEYAIIIQVASFAVIGFMVLSYIGDLIETTKNIAELSNINVDFFVLLIKALGVAIITKFATEICKDGENSTLAYGVELGGKIVILSMCIPMIKAVAGLAVKIIKG